MDVSRSGCSDAGSEVGSRCSTGHYYRIRLFVAVEVPPAVAGAEVIEEKIGY